MKRIIALLLVLIMIVSLAACGTNASSQAEDSTEAVHSAPVEEVSTEAEVPETDEAAASAAEAEEEAALSVVEEAPVVSINYPIDGGGHTLSVLACRRFLAADALGDNDYSAQYTYPELAKRTGVDIEFNMLSEATYVEQTNLLISSEDFPDIFANGVGSYDQNMLGALEDGIVYDLTDTMAENAPDYYALIQSHPEWAASIATDGHYLTFQTCNIGVQSQGIMLRGDWMDELGLEIPTTIDELKDVLRAMHNAYDSPMTLLINRDLGDGLYTAFNHGEVGYSMNLVNFQQTAPNSGEVISAIASEGYFNHLTFMRELYEEGIINEDFLGIAKELGNYESSYYSNVCGAWYDGAETVDNGANAKDASWVALPISMPTYKDEEIHMSSYAEYGRGPSNAIVSGGSEQPEIAMMFLNYGYTPEGRELIQLGIENETFVRNEDGSVAYTELLTEYERGVRTAQWAYLTNSWMQTEQLESAVYMMYSDTATAACEMWTADAAAAGNSMTLPVGLSLNEDETAVVNQYLTDISTYFSEMATKYVICEITADEYKQALEEANKIGLDDVTAAYQSAFDRYMAS